MAHRVAYTKPKGVCKVIYDDTLQIGYSLSRSTQKIRYVSSTGILMVAKIRYSSHCITTLGLSPREFSHMNNSRKPISSQPWIQLIPALNQFLKHLSRIILPTNTSQIFHTINSIRSNWILRLECVVEINTVQ